MKKLLLFSLFIPFASSAQVEISALGGGSFNAGTFNHSNSGLTGVKKSNVAPYGSLKIAYLTNGFGFGVSADFVSIKQSQPSGYSYYDPKSNKETPIDYILKPYKPGLNTSIFANKIFEQNKSSFYIGLNVGYMFSLSSGLDFSEEMDPYTRPNVNDWKKPSNGITFGLQAGYTYRLTDRLKLKAEFAPRYLYSLKAFGEKDHQHTYNTIVLPLGLGISVSI